MAVEKKKIIVGGDGFGPKREFVRASISVLYRSGDRDPKPGRHTSVDFDKTMCEIVTRGIEGKKQPATKEAMSLARYVDLRRHANSKIGGTAIATSLEEYALTPVIAQHVKKLKLVEARKESSKKENREANKEAKTDKPKLSEGNIDLYQRPRYLALIG